MIRSGTFFAPKENGIRRIFWIRTFRVYHWLVVLTYWRYLYSYALTIYLYCPGSLVTRTARTICRSFCLLKNVTATSEAKRHSNYRILHPNIFVERVILYDECVIKKLSFKYVISRGNTRICAVIILLNRYTCTLTALILTDLLKWWYTAVLIFILSDCTNSIRNQQISD